MATRLGNPLGIAACLILCTFLVWPLSLSAQSSAEQAIVESVSSTDGGEARTEKQPGDATFAFDTAAAGDILPAENYFPVEKLDDAGRVIGDFVVGPGKVEIELEPGESKTVEMTITNRMGDTRAFQLAVEDAAGGRSADQAVVLLGSDRGPYTVRDYVHFPITRFELDHMERVRVPVTVTLPADAEPGGRYGSVLVSTVSRKADTGGENGAAPSSAIISRIGTLFFITTPGDVAKSGELKSFSTIPSTKLFWNGPINFAILFENTGSIHLNPYGHISISNMLGDEVGFVELDPWFALPQSLRTREISWTRELLIGRYTATAFINRGYDNVIDEATVTFWVIPWKMLLLVLSGLFVFFLLLRLFFSKFEFKRK